MIARTNPLQLLRLDREQARARGDQAANVCVVATIDNENEPNLRTLVLRDVDDRLALFVNRTSPKVAEFENSSTVAVLIYLPSVSVQYRLTCELAPVNDRIVRESWQMRPETAKKLDVLYESFPQGSAIPSQFWLQDQIDKTDLPKQATASVVGYFLEPKAVVRLELHDERGGVHWAQRFCIDVTGNWIVTTQIP